MESDASPTGLPPISLTEHQVFPDSDSNEPYIEISSWDVPVQYFIGRNGSGKSRTARLLSHSLGGHFLSTDRLIGLMNFSTFGFGAVPREYRGTPMGVQERQMMTQQTRNLGSATEELYILKEQPAVGLRVAAFLKRSLGRLIQLREESGFLDPVVQVGGIEYSLFRDEGHGLRELVVLLTAVYRQDWQLLVVDEPELHLHPSMARLWITELSRECAATARHAVVVSHEPSIVKPRTREDLQAIWLFSNGRPPQRIGDQVLDVQADRVAASLKENPQLISLLAFSPRPVLVEGVIDVAALTVALNRSQPAEVVAQTDLVDCGGSGKVGLWLEISRKLGLDVKAIADLDSLFATDVQRVMDARPDVQAEYQAHFFVEPPKTSEVLKSLIAAANKDGVPPESKERAKWLAGLAGSVHADKRDRLLAIWRDAGLWLHSQGTLEDVLGLDPKDKGAPQAAAAAETCVEIEAVAEWCAYDLDPSGDLEELLNLSMERLAHEVMEHERINPGAAYRVARTSDEAAASGLASVRTLGDGRYRITVNQPVAFKGYWVEFSRTTPASDLVLRPPTA